MKGFRIFKTLAAFLLLGAAALKLYSWENLGTLHQAALIIETCLAYALLANLFSAPIENRVILWLFVAFSGYQVASIWSGQVCRCFGDWKPHPSLGLFLNFAVIMVAAFYVRWFSPEAKRSNAWNLALIGTIFVCGFLIKPTVVSKQGPSIESKIANSIDSSNPLPVYFVLVRPGCKQCDDQKSIASIVADSWFIPLVVFATDHFDECPNCIPIKEFPNSEVPVVGCIWMDAPQFLIVQVGP